VCVHARAHMYVYGGGANTMVGESHEEIPMPEQLNHKNCQVVLFVVSGNCLMKTLINTGTVKLTRHAPRIFPWD
jgi:hypothetical protein